MPKNQPPDSNIPKTPLRIYERSDLDYAGPFFVAQEVLADNGDLGEIDDAEIEALAHLIYNAYLECKKQLPTSESPASAK